MIKRNLLLISIRLTTCDCKCLQALYGNPISKIIKKINRKLIAFYVESIVDDQNDYNIYTHRAIAMLPDRFQDTDERLFELEKKLAKCEKTIEELKSQLEK